MRYCKAVQDATPCWRNLRRELSCSGGQGSSLNPASQLPGCGVCEAQATLTFSFILLKIMELDSTVVYRNEDLDLTEMSKNVIDGELQNSLKEYYVAIIMIL